MAKAIKQKIDEAKMTHAQQQFLLKELRNFSYYKVPVPTVPKSKKVLAAEKQIKRLERVVNSHATTRRRVSDRMRKKYDALKGAAQRAVYFGTPDKALAAVDRLRRFCETGK